MIPNNVIRAMKKIASTRQNLFDRSFIISIVVRFDPEAAQWLTTHPSRYADVLAAIGW